jgi:hypothetical protein
MLVIKETHCISAIRLFILPAGMPALVTKQSLWWLETYATHALPSASMFIVQGNTCAGGVILCGNPDSCRSEAYTQMIDVVPQPHTRVVASLWSMRTRSCAHAAGSRAATSATPALLLRLGSVTRPSTLELKSPSFSL